MTKITTKSMMIGRSDAVGDRRPRGAGGTRRTLMVGVLVLVGLVALAPRIASLALFRPTLAGLVADQIDGRIEWSHISLGWLSPIRLKDARIYDRQGNLVISVGELSTNQTLLRFVWGNNDLGRFEIQKPNANVVVRPGGSNLEDVFAKFLISDPANNDPLPKVTLEWSDGSAQIASATGLAPVQISAANGKVELGNPDVAMAFSVSAQVQGKGMSNGAVQLEGTAGSPSKGDLNQGRVTLHTQNAPIDVAALILARLGESAECQGLVNGDANIQWNLTTPEIVIELDNFRGSQLAIAASRWLHSDRLLVAEMSATGKLGLHKTNLSAEQLRCRSEFADINASGAIDWTKLPEVLTGSALPDTDFQLGGNIDIARLSQMLPNALRLRQGVQIQSANLTFQSFSRLEGGRRRLLIDGEAKDFVGMRDNLPIRWSKPVRVSAALIQDDRQARLESAQIETNSISIHGQGTGPSGTINARGDLDQLQTELDQFFALDDVKLSGRFEGDVQWQADQAIVATTSWPVQLTGSIKLEGLLVDLPGLEPSYAKSFSS